MTYRLTLAICLALPGAAAFGDQLFTEDVIIVEDLLCVGPSCVDSEPNIPFRSGVKLKGNAIGIYFDDTSTVAGSPSRDWSLNANEDNAGTGESFYVTDVTSGTNPFWIAGAAPSNALFIEGVSGKIGMGTALPQQDLHIVDSFLPAIRIEETGTSPYKWDLIAYSDGFFLRDAMTSETPFRVRDGAPSAAFEIEDNGDVGLGTDAAEGKLHTKGNGVQLAYFESGDGGPVQVRFRTNSENRRFLAVNNANEVKSQIIFKDNEIQFTGATDSGANRWLTIGPAGIVSQGGTCNVTPCDRTFDPEYFTVPPIEERAAYMWQNMHLPAIGPTTAGAPINLTEKTTGIIHELEVAHIYIEELHRELERVNARLEALEARQD